jgi:serine/threonine protein kinase/Tol biopolymer transport system component
MGEVYRARDSKLNRDVALKILPDLFAQDPDRLARFEREAVVLASLNHPNIGAIYGLQERALVLELVEGETLADRIAAGPIPVAEALPIARQICEALEAAHERGIVHRDLKPANVKLRSDGTVKVLDFGLAKAMTPTIEARRDITLSPTIAGPTATVAGVILGTVAYMSPEQAKGLDADQRSDVFSFGCVLYEMLTGQPPFKGETVSDVLASVLARDPDLSRLPLDLIPRLGTLLERCLEKNPRRRWQAVGDLRLELEAIAASPHSTPALIAPAPWWKRSAMISATAVVLTAAVMGAAWYALGRSTPDDRVIRFEVVLPVNVSDVGPPPVISPDGTRLAFVGRLQGRVQLWIRSIDSTAAQPLAGTDGADYPFWSPDSQSVAFFADGKLRAINPSGGAARTICDAPTGRGGAWNQNGIIVIASSANGGLERVSSTGGTATPATTLDLDRGEVYHRSPTFLPDGHRFLFAVQGTEPGIYVASLDVPGHTHVVALETISSVAAVAPDYVLFVQGGVLMAQRLDTQTLTQKGAAVSIAEPVGTYNLSSSTFSVSRNGVLAYSSGTGGVGGGRQLTWFDRTGKIVGRVGSPIPIADLAISPDQTRAAVQWSANDLRVVDLVRGGNPSRLTFDVSVEDFPVWSPDGTRILYTSTVGGGQNLYSKLASGAGNQEEVLKSLPVKRPTDWSSRYILYEQDNAKGLGDLWVLPLFDDKKPRLVLGEPFSEQQGKFSPDEKWIAYVSNETGVAEVYAQSFPPSGGKWQLSSGGGVTPRWRRDGKELFYLAPDRKIMSVDVGTNGTALDHTPPKALFETTVDAVNTVATNRYDVSADGQRFLVAPVDEARSERITIVVNWSQALKRIAQSN